MSWRPKIRPGGRIPRKLKKRLRFLRWSVTVVTGPVWVAYSDGPSP